MLVFLMEAAFWIDQKGNTEKWNLTFLKLIYYFAFKNV